MVQEHDSKLSTFEQYFKENFAHICVVMCEQDDGFTMDLKERKRESLPFEMPRDVYDVMTDVSGFFTWLFEPKTRHNKPTALYLLVYIDIMFAMLFVGSRTWMNSSMSTKAIQSTLSAAARLTALS